MATKARSPNYPAISLPKAVDLTERLYNEAHTHKASSAAVANALGYAGLNGASLGVISALKKYGLVEGVGTNELKVSKDGLTIVVDPKSSTERAAAILRSAFRPALFAELRAEYGDKPPKTDEFLRAFLLKKGFVQSVVSVPIRTYRETMELVESAQSVLGDASQGQAPRARYEDQDAEGVGHSLTPVSAESETQAQLLHRAPVAQLSQPADTINDVYKLTEGRAFTLSWPIGLTADEYEDFETWISLIQRKLKRQIEPMRPVIGGK